VSVAVLADFGSTFTKVALVDEADGRLLARAEAPTTIGTDLMDGYADALRAARARAGDANDYGTELAVSSAGGGLRVAAVGLVADLTAAAARQAALNAGARISSVLAGPVGAAERERLQRERPEIVLFAGGTDGGQRAKVLENASALAECELDAVIVIACNQEVADEVAELLRRAGHLVEIAPNVMPALGRLEIDGARQAILRAFIKHVIRGKRLSANPRFEQIVKMPTPDAVLRATELLANGAGSRAGVGDVVVVDVGGATTDVHSHRTFKPVTPGIDEPLVPVPMTVRSVEGDLGLRAGAPGVVDADADWLAAKIARRDAADLTSAAAQRESTPQWIPVDGSERRLDDLLAVSCSAHALNRHCGRMLLRVDGSGPPKLVRTGPDLREARRLVGTGGILAHHESAVTLLRDGLERRAPRSLSPRSPEVSIDRSYVLAAAGLLSTRNPEAAFRLMERELLRGDG
jgi:uncharacterized protein (TIGR01319 family)